MKAKNLRIGQKVRIFGSLCHVVCHDNGNIVVKRWLKTKQRWVYEGHSYDTVDWLKSMNKATSS